MVVLYMTNKEMSFVWLRESNQEAAGWILSVITVYADSCYC